MARAVSRRRRTPARHAASLRLGLVFAGLIGLNVYFFFFRGGTSLPGLLKAAEIHREPTPPQQHAAPVRGTVAAPPVAKSSAAQPAVAPASDGGRTIAVTLRAGDSVAGVLAREGVSSRVALSVSDALGRVVDLRRAHAGHTIVLRFDGDDLLRALDYRLSPTIAFRVERRAQPSGDTWRGAKLGGALESRTVVVTGTIVNSLDETVRHAGEDASLATELLRVLAWDLDLARDIAPGDRFRVVVEKETRGGAFDRYGHILAVEWAGRPTVHAWWWERGGGWFTESGDALARSLLRSPIGYRARGPSDKLAAPTSSPTGADFPVLPGASARSLADGRVTARSPSSISIRSSGGMDVSYSRLRVARSLAIGDAVRQQQSLGVVDGHLHIAVRMGGRGVDPLRLTPARAASLPPADRAAFLKVAASLR